MDDQGAEQRRSARTRRPTEKLKEMDEMQGLLAEVVPPDHPTSAPTIAPTGLSGPPVFPNLVNPPIMAHYDPPVSTQLPPMSSHSPFFHSALYGSRKDEYEAALREGSARVDERCAVVFQCNDPENFPPSRINIEVPSADGSRMRKFWSKRSMQSLVVHAVLSYARLSYTLTTSSSLSVTAAMNEPLPLTSLATGEQNLAALQARIVLIKPPNAPSLSQALMSAAQGLSRSDKDSTLPATKKARSAFTWRKARVLAVAPLVAQQAANAWQIWHENGKYVDLARIVSDALMRGGAQSRLDEVEFVLVCVVATGSEVLLPQRHEITSQFIVSMFFTTGENLEATLLQLAVNQWSLQHIHLGFTDSDVMTLLCAPRSINDSSDNAPIALRLDEEDIIASSLPSVLPSAHCRRLLSLATSDDPQSAKVASLMAHSGPMFATEVSSLKRYAIQAHGGALYLHELLPVDVPLVESFVYSRDADHLRGISEFSELVHETALRYSDASEAGLSRTPLSAKAALSGLSVSLPANLQTSVFIEKRTRALFTVRVDKSIKDGDARRYVESLRTLLARCRLSTKRLERAQEYLHALAGVIRTAHDDQDALLSHWKDLQRVSARHAASSARHERLVNYMNTLLPALSISTSSFSKVDKTSKKKLSKLTVAPDADKYRYYAQYKYDAPGTREEGVREELRGREPHYRDKKRKHDLVDHHLNAVPSASLYALYWRSQEAKQNKRDFDDYDA